MYMYRFTLHFNMVSYFFHLHSLSLAQCRLVQCRLPAHTFTVLHIFINFSDQCILLHTFLYMYQNLGIFLKGERRGEGGSWVVKFAWE